MEYNNTTIVVVISYTLRSVLCKPACQRVHVYIVNKKRGGAFIIITVVRKSGGREEGGDIRFLVLEGGHTSTMYTDRQTTCQLPRREGTTLPTYHSLLSCEWMHGRGIMKFSGCITHHIHTIGRIIYHFECIVIV